MSRFAFSNWSARASAFCESVVSCTSPARKHEFICLFLSLICFVNAQNCLDPVFSGDSLACQKVSLSALQASLTRAFQFLRSVPSADFSFWLALCHRLLTMFLVRMISRVFAESVGASLMIFFFGTHFSRASSMASLSYITASSISSAELRRTSVLMDASIIWANLYQFALL